MEEEEEDFLEGEEGRGSFLKAMRQRFFSTFTALERPPPSSFRRNLFLFLFRRKISYVSRELANEIGAGRPDGQDEVERPSGLRHLSRVDLHRDLVEVGLGPRHRDREACRAHGARIARLFVEERDHAPRERDRPLRGRDVAAARKHLEPRAREGPRPARALPRAGRCGRGRPTGPGSRAGSTEVPPAEHILSRRDRRDELQELRRLSSSGPCRRRPRARRAGARGRGC